MLYWVGCMDGLFDVNVEISDGVVDVICLGECWREF